MSRLDHYNMLKKKMSSLKPHKNTINFGGGEFNKQTLTLTLVHECPILIPPNQVS